MKKYVPVAFLSLSSLWAAEPQDIFVPKEVRQIIFGQLDPHTFTQYGLAAKKDLDEKNDPMLWDALAREQGIYTRPGQGQQLLVNHHSGLHYLQKYKQATTEDEKKLFLEEAIKRLNIPVHTLYPKALEALYEIMRTGDFIESLEIVRLPASLDLHYGDRVFDDLLAKGAPLTAQEHIRLISHHKVKILKRDPESLAQLIAKLKGLKFENPEQSLIVNDLFIKLLELEDFNLSDADQYDKFIKTILVPFLEEIKDAPVDVLDKYPLTYLDLIISKIKNVEGWFKVMPQVVEVFLKRALTEEHPTALMALISLDNYLKENKAKWRDHTLPSAL